MSTALELITGAMHAANILEAGETPQPGDSSDALTLLNDLLDSLSTDEDYVYTSSENIFSPGWNPGQYQYTIGNPVGGTFTGTLTNGSPTITGVTVPSTLIAKGTLTDFQNLIPAGTTVLSFNAGAGTVTMSANATASSTGLDIVTYTTPGYFGIQRPLRVTQCFTRITSSGNTGLDYFCDISNIDRYTELGYKGVPGPWPIQLIYQPTFPLGTLWVYPNPSQAGEVHLWVDLIFTQFASLTQNVNLPQGYNRSLKKLLALEMCAEYGKTPSRELHRQAKEARDFLKSQNASPVVTLRYDSDIVRSQQKDAGWIMFGGFV
jgi:hypothetical protein